MDAWFHVHTFCDVSSLKALRVCSKGQKRAVDHIFPSLVTYPLNFVHLVTHPVKKIKLIDNQPLDRGFLPLSVSHLKIGGAFNSPLAPGVLPESLSSLTLGGMYSHPTFHGILPTELKTLIIGRCFTTPILPATLPKSLTSIDIGDCLKHLSGQQLGTFFDQLSSALPFLGSLSMCLPRGQALEQRFPESLTTLVLKMDTGLQQTLIPGILPPLLLNLSLFGRHVSYIILQGALPQNLESLTFGNYFNELLAPGVLPESLVTLTLGTNFNQPLAPGVLPESLSILNINRRYNYPLNINTRNIRIYRCD